MCHRKVLRLSPSGYATNGSDLLSTPGIEVEPDPVKLIRLNINVSEQTAAILRRWKAEGITATDLVRRAVALYDLLEKEQRRGREIQIVDPERQEVQALRLVV